VTPALDPAHNYCTGFPDVVFGVDLRPCCNFHDLAYAAHADKITADLNLALCVAHEGLGGIGLLMLAGVTLFGWAFYRKRKR
jgi:hypothetical protein